MIHNLRWADSEMHRRYGTEHFLVTGATGSGKTLLIKMLLRSVLESDLPCNALVYDAKQDLLPFVGLLNEERGGLGTELVVLHPFDKNCFAWNLAADIKGPVSARQLATILVPEDKGNNSEPFFTYAARDLMTCMASVLSGCAKNRDAWTFRDLLLACLYEPYTRLLLQFTETRDGKPFAMTSRVRESYLDGDKKTASNIRSTINAKLSIYEPIAQSWHEATQAGRAFSLTKWLERKSKRSVLILGNDELARGAIDSINRAIFKRIAEILLSQEDQRIEDALGGRHQTWLFLDEVREAGHLEGLGSVLTKGRSKGACVVLGLQDIEGLRSVYGLEIANEICGQCNNIAILRLNSPSTAQWAVELFGRNLAISVSDNRSLDSEGHTNINRGTTQQERSFLQTSDLIYLQPPSPSNGLNGFFRSPNIDPKLHRLGVNMPWETVMRYVNGEPGKAKSGEHSYGLMNPDDLYLQPWTDADMVRLGIEGPVPALVSKSSNPADDILRGRP